MNGFSSGFAARTAASAGDAVCHAMSQVSTEYLSQCSRLTATVNPVRAEEHLIVALSAINQAVWDHNLRGAQFDALREALAEQMVQLADAVREADGAQDTQFGDLDEVQS